MPQTETIDRSFTPAAGSEQPPVDSSTLPQVYIIGGNFELRDGTASTNLSVELARGFDQHGFRATMIPLNQQRKLNWAQEHRYRGIECHRFKLPVLDNLRLPGISWLRGWVVLMGLTLTWIVPRRRPKLVFCMTMWWWAQAWLSLIGRCLGIKTVFYLVEEPQSLAEMKFENRDMGAWRFRFERWQAGWLYTTLALPSGVCCITAKLCQKVIDQGIPADRVFLLPNVRFRDKAEISEGVKEHHPAGEPIRIVYSGRINYTRDDFSTLLTAAEQIVDRRLPVHIHIYGSGPEKDIKLIKERIVSTGLKDTVFMHGFVARQELESAQRLASACLLLKADIKQNEYNFPTKLMDYLDASRPVIMTDIENHRAFFQDRVNCYFVTPEDSKNLIEVFEEIVEHRQESTAIGERGKIVLEERFDSYTNVGRLLEFVLPFENSEKP